MTEDEAIERCKKAWCDLKDVLDQEEYWEFYHSLLDDFQNGDHFHTNFFKYNWTPEVESEIRKRWRTQNSKLGKALR